MTWNELKPLIEDDLLSRQLKDPSIRLRALDNIEALLKVHMPDLLNDILAICNIEKNEFKKLITHYKGKELNGAEKSVINDIYRHCQGIEYDIQVALHSQNYHNNQKYRIIACPYCFTQHKLTEDLYDENMLHCPECHNDFQNPSYMEKIINLDQKASAITRLGCLIPLLIFGILYVIVYLFG